MKKWSPDTNAEHFSALDTWTTSELLTEAIKRLGDKPVTSASIIDSLNTLKDFQTTYSALITYAPGGAHKDPGRCLQMLITVAGKLVAAGGASAPRLACSSIPATPA